MEDLKQKLSRRHFLRGAALTAATTVIAACGGEAATPPAGPTAAAPAPTTGSAPVANTTIPTLAPATAVPTVEAAAAKESPLTAQMVKDGKLPAVAERLPKKPYVVPHKWLTPGKYGGTIQFTINGAWGITGIIRESQYGHSILRYLNDGLEIGPGLAESWESNADATKWTFKFREGLKWSDGKPWTMADILYWWEDMVQFKNKDNADLSHSEGPPDEARSGKGTLMTLKAVDDYTMELTFDAPAPLTADRLAMWVNAGIGPRWMGPKHYLQQFHPKYTPSVKDFKKHDEMMGFTNPDCPSMNGWYLTQFQEGVRTVWSRNPFYWAVDKDGNQLPYIDTINVTGVQNAEAQKLAYLSGKADFALHHDLTLADVSALKEATPKSKLEVRFWDSGSGTASIFFLSQDYKEEKYRTLFKEPKFRKALSMAFNRAEAQKVIYYNTGELTTGTMSPKAIEYQFNDEAKQRYAEFRDAAAKYDPEAAKALLDGLGLKAGADGFRTFADGSEMKIRLDYPADAAPNGEHLNKNQILSKNWKDVGINAVLNPVPPAGYDDQWRAGEIMSKTAWEVGDGPNHLVYPQWMVPIEPDRWAPLQGQWYNVKGTEKEGTELDVDPYQRKPARVEPDKGGPVEKIWGIYDQTKIEPDVMKRHKLVWDIIKIHVENGPFFQGTVANYPRIILVSTDLKNVPQKEDLATGGFVNPWIIPFPAVVDPETWFFDNPEAHA